jgi:hypothetical protein
MNKYITVESNSNIPCCELLAQQVRATFASDSRMWRAHLAWIWRINVCHANVTRTIRVRCASCSPRSSCNVARTTRDVTFGPLCNFSTIPSGHEFASLFTYQTFFCYLFSVCIEFITIFKCQAWCGPRRIRSICIVGSLRLSTRDCFYSIVCPQTFPSYILLVIRFKVKNVFTKPGPYGVFY